MGSPRGAPAASRRVDPTAWGPCSLTNPTRTTSKTCSDLLRSGRPLTLPSSSLPARRAVSEFRELPKSAASMYRERSLWQLPGFRPQVQVYHHLQRINHMSMLTTSTLLACRWQCGESANGSRNAKQRRACRMCNALD